MKGVMLNILILTAVLLMFANFAYGAASNAINILPQGISNYLRQNFTIPLHSSSTLTFSTLRNALKQNLLQLTKLNNNIRDTTGIDIAKFVNWIYGIILLILHIITNSLQTISVPLHGFNR